MTNSIHNLETKMVRNETGEFPAIVLGVNIPDAESASAFMDRVVEQFKLQRMSSPPETANMVVTVAGVVNAAEFRDAWLARCAVDPILRHFTSVMVHADILHIRGAELLDQASLIEGPSSQRA